MIARPTERGFALITVLWLITALSAVVGLGLAGARLGQRVTLNRIVLARARWAAEACLAIAEARRVQGRRSDTATIDLGRDTWCAWRIEDPGARLNVNVADQTVLARIIGDSLAQTLLARRRERTFAAVAELLPMPGFPATDTVLLTVDGPGTVNANAAPARVLLALPGLTPEAVERIIARRGMGRPIGSLDHLAGELSPSARAELLAHYPDLARTLAFAPQQLVLIAQGWVDTSGAGSGERGAGLRATIELLVVPLPERLAVIRRRMR